MNKSDKIREETALKNLMRSFIDSYAMRDKSVDFSSWLANRLQQEMPEMPLDVSEKLSKDIIEAVATYEQTLSDLNKAVESGQSKEEWLASRMAEAYSGMPFDDIGNKLQQIDNTLNTSNAILMQEIEIVPDGAEMDVDAETVDWNEYGILKKVYDIGRQVVMSGIGAAAAAIKRSMESSENISLSAVIEQALRDGVSAASDEIKAVVAGAIKAAAEKGLTDFLPADTPLETICDVAGAAVEIAGALFNAATGKTTLIEALDKMGRACVAAASRFCSDVFKGKLAIIPVIGPIVVEVAGNLLEHMKSAKFNENVYATVRGAARTAWEGIKQAGYNILNRLTNSVAEKLLN